MATYYEKIATEHMEKFYVERRDVYHKPFSKVEKLEDISIVEKQPKLEGRNMFTILAKKA